MIIASDYGAQTQIVLQELNTPDDVQKAYDVIVDDPDASSDQFAMICAGVLKAGSKRAAKKRLDELLKADSGFNGNDVKKLHSRANELVKNAAVSEEQSLEQEYVNIFSNGLDSKLAIPSMDIAAPLGNTLDAALATLELRWSLVNMQGRFVALRNPSSNSAETSGALLMTMTKADFASYHSDRLIEQNDENPVNPAAIYFKYGKRYSGISFAPPPNKVGDTTCNLYRGVNLEPKQGDFSLMMEFILKTVCRDRKDLFDFVWLYLAHLVQHPGQKPGTSIVLRGKGGTGKSSFGLMLEKLSAPNCLSLADQEHVTGRFAGQHLSTAIMCICTEALFAGDPSINGKIKNLITSPTSLVEPKGFPAFEMPSCTRFYFDSNGDRVVPIDGNGPERRYLVMEINDDHQEDQKYFKRFYDDLNGEGMAVLMWELQQYDPEADGMSWGMLRTAPETAERRQMRWHSMRRVERSLIQIFGDGEFNIRNENGKSYRYKLDTGKAFRLPVSELRRHLSPVSNKYDANDGDIIKLMETLFGETLIDVSGKEHSVAKVARGRVDCFHLVREDEKSEKWEPVIRQKERYVEFPPLDLLRAQIAVRYERS